VGDDGLWYPKMDPHSFEEELGSIYHCYILLASSEDGHLQKPINDKKICSHFLVWWMKGQTCNPLRWIPKDSWK
jgi:hypothetical protein